MLRRQAAQAPRLARGLQAGSQPKIKRYELSSTSRGSACTVLTSTGHTCTTDLPVRSGGKDSAPQPVELLVAALIGCKTATAHYVARNQWPRPHHRIKSITFESVVATRDERGALALPISEAAPCSAALLRISGVAKVHAASECISNEDVQILGAAVEHRCPVAATLAAGGCQLDFEWQLEPSGTQAE